MLESKFKETEIGMIPEDWEVVRLDNLFKISAGGDLKKLTFSKTKSNEYLYPIFSNSLNNKGLYGFSKTYQYESECVTITGRGNVGRAECRKEPFCAIVRLLVLKPKQEISCYFVASFINTKLDFSHVGSAVNQLTAPKISEFKIAIPSLPEQSAIAKILSDLDSKIELLQKQNKTLEKIGQAIFKHWFVDFEFPNEKGKPYKSSGGEMVESELGEIPEGWSVGKLGDLIIKNRKPIKKYEDWKDKDLIDLSNMPQFSMSITTFDKGEKFKSNIFELEKLDILFGSIRPYFGKYGFSPIDGAITGTIYSLKPKNKNYYSFVLNTICRKEFVNYTIRLSKGTKMPIIGWNDFSDFEVVLPKEREIIIKFNKIIFPTILKLKKNIQEILPLQKIRDLLLPKLMTGKIRVPLEVEG